MAEVFMFNTFVFKGSSFHAKEPVLCTGIMNQINNTIAEYEKEHSVREISRNTEISTTKISGEIGYLILITSKFEEK